MEKYYKLHPTAISVIMLVLLMLFGWGLSKINNMSRGLSVKDTQIKHLKKEIDGLEADVNTLGQALDKIERRQSEVIIRPRKVTE